MGQRSSIQGRKETLGYPYPTWTWRGRGFRAISDPTHISPWNPKMPRQARVFWALCFGGY